MRIAWLYAWLTANLRRREIPCSRQKLKPGFAPPSPNLEKCPFHSAKVAALCIIAGKCTGTIMVMPFYYFALDLQLTKFLTSCTR